MTIIGLEKYTNGARSLLVFDPSYSPCPGIRDLVGMKRIGSRANIRALLQLHRRGTPYLYKYPEFELLTWVYHMLSPQNATFLLHYCWFFFSFFSLSGPYLVTERSPTWSMGSIYTSFLEAGVGRPWYSVWRRGSLLIKEHEMYYLFLRRVVGIGASFGW